MAIVFLAFITGISWNHLNAFPPLGITLFIFGLLGTGIFIHFLIVSPIPLFSFRMSFLFKGIFLVVFSCLLLGLSKLFIHHIHRQKEEQQKIILDQELMIRDLQKSEQVMDNILANASHEFKTPITGVVGLVDTILRGKDGNVNVKVKRHLELVRTCGYNLLNLVKEFLDTAKIQSGMSTLKIKEFDIYFLIEEILKTTSVFIGEKPITIQNLVPPNLNKVWGDREKIRQVLTNVINNAIKYSQKGTIEIDALPLTPEKQNGTPEIKKTGPSKLLVSVSDTGIGIGPEDIKIIFDRFKRSKATKDKPYTGSGLGLFICKTIIEKHFGNIWADSTLGKGSTFYFTIPEETFEPLKDTSSLPKLDMSQHITPPQKKENRRVQIPSRTLTGDGEVIMIIDSFDMNIEYMTNILESNKYHVISATSSEAALEHIKTTIPKLCIVNTVLDKMDGFKLTQHLKSGATTHHIPVILLSSKNVIPDKLAGFEVGADDYIVKPIDKQDLLTRVKRLLINAIMIGTLHQKETTIQSSEILPTQSNIPISSKRQDIQKLVKGNGQKVLIVEDSKTNQEILINRLTSNNYRVSTALNGKEGLEKILDSKPDIIVLDIMMPVMDGYKFTDHIKHDEIYKEYADIPIIMLTAKVSEEDKIYGLNLGADDYVTKPYDPQELVARINVLLRIKRLQAHLKNWNQELESQVYKRTHELNRLQDQLVKSEKMASITNLIITVNHELNSPLMAVMIAAQKLMSQTKTAEELKYAKIVLSGSLKIRHIIENLHDITDPLEVEYSTGVKMIQFENKSPPKKRTPKKIKQSKSKRTPKKKP
ncbi:MAG: response regulator [Candidatus Margulisbacteria bacterium]|nr:response regulator [Candidatus Margulisiibacteriota bacterium]